MSVRTAMAARSITTALAATSIRTPGDQGHEARLEMEAGLSGRAVADLRRMCISSNVPRMKRHLSNIIHRPNGDPIMVNKLGLGVAFLPAFFPLCNQLRADHFVRGHFTYYGGMSARTSSRTPTAIS